MDRRTYLNKGNRSMNSAQPNPDKSKILIVDDHPIFCLGMSELINEERDLIVCGSADTVGKAWAAIRGLNPDLVIVDISLKNSNGIDLVKEIHNERSDLPVLVLSMHDESLYAERALLSGARGYIMKQEATKSVVRAIRTVLSGKIYASEEIKEKMLMRKIAPRDINDPSPLDKLTTRELEVFRLLGAGLSTKEISDRLNIAMKTVGTYRERIKEKLELKHATELVKFAVHWTKNL
jgi:DNA-binding NarL/FixJ family response regulator